MTADPASLGREVWDRLHPEDREWLRSLAREAGPGARVALVGGAVRDALLGGTPLDLDVAVEGADAGALAAASGLPALVHPAFGNATVTLPDGRQADLVRTRRETRATTAATTATTGLAEIDDAAAAAASSGSRGRKTRR